MMSINDQYSKALSFIYKLEEISNALESNSTDKEGLHEAISETGFFSNAERSVKEFAETYFQKHNEETDLSDQLRRSENKLIDVLLKAMKRCYRFDEGALSTLSKVYSLQSDTDCINIRKQEIIDSIINQFCTIHDANRSLTSSENAFIDKLRNSVICSQKNIVTFLKRGGKITCLEEGDKANLTKSNRLVVSSDTNTAHSQVLYKLLGDNECNIVCPPINYSSGMDPQAYTCCITEPHKDEIEAFHAALNSTMIKPLGGAEFGIGSNKAIQGSGLTEVKAFYQNKINDLMDKPGPITILAFQGMIDPIIDRLVESSQSLKDVEIIFFNCQATTPLSTSKGVLDFYNLLKNRISINN